MSPVKVNHITKKAIALSPYLHQTAIAPHPTYIKQRSHFHHP
ncbi:hypothetical protein [Sphaerospermopsis sp. LEGE 00249]|nr:hypothetical protein [Sphaerospermopsis sp. LEGE 00249]